MTVSISGVPQLQSNDAALARWAQAVNTAFESLRNAGLVTSDDLAALAKKYGLSVAAQRSTAPGDVVIDMGNGVSGSISISDLANKLIKNQAFKAAITPTQQTATTQTAPNNNAVDDLEARLLQITSELASQIANINPGTSTAGITRGAISACGVWPNWDNTPSNSTLAAQCVIWTLKNGGDINNVPAFPADPVGQLVIGDVVTFRYKAGVPANTVPYPSDDCDFEMSRQWLGKTVGWVEMRGTTSFESVVNLRGFALNVAALIGTSRGSVQASVTGHTWDDNLAACAVWNMITYGRSNDASAYPANKSPADFLVTGDTVFFAAGPDAFGGMSYMHTRQYVAGVGWEIFQAPYIGFNDVQNLSVFWAGVASVINDRGHVLRGTKVTDGQLRTGEGILIDDPTLKEIIDQFDYNKPGTQAYNTLNALANLTNQLNAVAPSRAPILNAYGQVPFTAGGIEYPSAWNDSVASWCVLYQMYHNMPAWYYPMPTIWLVKGDRCRLFNPDGSFDETRQWTGVGWV